MNYGNHQAEKLSKKLATNNQNDRSYQNFENNFLGQFFHCFKLQQ